MQIRNLTHPQPPLSPIIRAPREREREGALGGASLRVKRRKSPIWTPSPLGESWGEVPDERRAEISPRIGFRRDFPVYLGKISDILKSG